MKLDRPEHGGFESGAAFLPWQLANFQEEGPKPL